jgi:hypothetical protein
MNDLHKRLAGRQALADLLAQRLVANALDKGLYNRQRDVGLEKR